MDYQLYALLRRDSCNNGVDLNGVDLKQPIDLFRHIYSYACGDSYANATIPILEDCDIVDFGTCSFGGVNIIPSDLFPLTESDESWLEVFEDWMISAMVEISLLVTVCLPIDLDPCTELIDDVLAEDEINFQHMNDGYDEVSRNIITTTKCVISDSKQFLLCPEGESATAGPSNHSLFPAFSNTTVGDVKSAVEHLLFALTNGTFIATLASNNTGVDIALSSIALSQPLDFQSEHFNTQIEVQGALQTLVEAIDDVDEVRIGAFDTLTSSLAGGSLLDFLVNVTDRIVIVKEDYVNFLDSRSNETKATREHFTDKFRYVRTSMWGAILQICLFCLSRSSSCQSY